MSVPFSNLPALRAYRNSRLYRSLTRTLRVYNRLLLVRIRARGFEDFQPAFPAMLSNLDTNGTTIGVLAMRAGVTRQAAGQLLGEIERRGYIERRESAQDGRATLVRFTARGRRLLSTVIEIVDEIEGDFAAGLASGEYDRVREGLLRIADRIDPEGAFGTPDQPERSGEPKARRLRAAPRAQRTGTRRTS